MFKRIVISIILILSNSFLFSCIALAGEKTADDWGRLGITAMDNKEYDTAIDYCTKAIALDPQNLRAYYGRGLSYGYKQLFDKAIDDFSSALKYADDSIKGNIYLMRGTMYHSKKMKGEAIFDYKMALTYKLSDQDKQICTNSLKNLEDSPSSTTATKQQNDPVLEYANEALGYYQQGEFSRAEYYLNKAIQLSPNDNGLYTARCMCYVGREDYNRVISECRGLIDNGVMAKVYYARGYYYHKGSYEDKREQIIDDMLSAIKLNRYLYSAYDMLALYAVDERNYEWAIDILNEKATAARSNGNDTELRNAEQAIKLTKQKLQSK